MNLLKENEEVKREYERLANVLVEYFTDKPWTFSMIESLKCACKNIENHLDSKFYPQQFEVFLFVNEEERKVQMGYREKVLTVMFDPNAQEVTRPLLHGFKRLI